MRKNWCLSIVIIFPLFLAAEPRFIKPNHSAPSAFAIIVDKTTFQHTSAAILAYRDAVERDGLATWVVMDDWSDPEQIRTVAKKLYAERPPLEGIVLVGDIPIPMIRDAQHLTSAFKMDQERYPFNRSSVPSDRFYDDFDLKFDFLKRDSNDSLLFYYSLRADSPQRVEREIYSARIRPPVADSTKYTLIARYLKRVACKKTEQNLLDNILTFHGHGYHSEALNAWEDQTFALKEQFPYLTAGHGQFVNLYHSMSPDMKNIVLDNLQNPALDLAIFHAHGEYDTQYLIGYPPAENIDQNVAAIKMFLRSKMREAQRHKKSIEEVKKYYQQAYQFPNSWFDGADDDSLIQADSLYAARLDLYVADVNKIQPQAKVIIFDECFNGSFIKMPYVAGAYLFGDGQVIAAVANTVNVKQDNWADEHLGLLSYGIRLGAWHQQRVYLESHLFGDPTYHFSPLPESGDFQQRFQNRKLNVSQELKSPAVVRRTWAVAQLYQQQKAKSIPQLVQIYRTDPAFNVRLEALKCLADSRSPEFEKLLSVSVNDPFELIRRFSVNWMGLIGQSEFLPLLAKKTLWDVSERVSYTAKTAIEKLGPLQADSACRAIYEAQPKHTARERSNNLSKSFRRSHEWLWQEILPMVKNDTLSLKARIDEVRTFRNYQFSDAIPELLRITIDPQQTPQLRQATLEALGWYYFSYKRATIIATCETLLNDKNVPESVRLEAVKTRARLLAGPNDPVNP